MNLKRLELRGFKTFAHPSEFLFPAGITALVGPNGSGKSNIADALRWVLGEQNMRAVRGKRTEDVIFAGAPNRAPAGMAEVAITLDNCSGQLPVDFTEVRISRRAYRSGENEYLVNNSRVRLRDVNELLLRAGLADSIFTVIGQGMVDLALSLRADERRALVDEAADIKRFHLKLDETRDKLGTMEQGLLRARDLLAEIGPRLAGLATQAAKLREYQSLTSELQSVLRLWHEQVRDRLAGDLASAIARVEQTDVEAGELRGLLERGTQEADETHRLQVAEAQTIERLRGNETRLREEAEVVRRDVAVFAERCQALERMRVELKTEYEGLERSHAATRHQVEDIEAVSARLEGEIVALAESLAEVEARHHDELEQEETRLASIRSGNEELVRLRGRSSVLEERRRLVLERLAEAAAEVERVSAAGVHAKARASKLESRSLQARAEIDRLSADLLAATDDATRLANEIAAGDASLQEIGGQARRLARELDENRARLEVLEHWRDTNSAYSTGVRAVLQAATTRSDRPAVLTGIVGVSADLLKVPAELETAIEVALGNRAQDIVVERWRDAEAAIAMLKRSGAGRATFLPLDTLRMPARLALPIPKAVPGIRGVAAELVQFEPRYEAVVAQMLGRTLVAEDLQVARRALSICPMGWQMVTLEGEIARASGAVTGGARRAAEVGVLGRHRELRVLSQRVAQLERDAAEVTSILTTAREAQAEGRQHFGVLDNRRREREAGLRHATGTLAEIKAEVRIVADERSRVEASCSRIAEERVRLSEQLSIVATELEQLEMLTESRRQEMADLEEVHNDRAVERRVVADAISRQRAALAGRQRERTAQATLLAARRADLAVVSRQLSDKQVRLDATGGDLNTLRADSLALAERLAAKEAELARCRVLVASAKERSTTLELSARALAEDALRSREQLADTEAARREAGNELARLRERVDQAQEQAATDLGQAVAAEVWSAVPDEGVVRLPDEDQKRRVDRLRGLLRGLGMVNPQAIAEHEETALRHEFLSREVGDLENGARALRVLMAELQKTMRRRFEVTFEAVNAQFRRNFQRLFGGGSARLLLTQPDDMTQTGIDIVAQPPGRRLQNLALLSGGERALTAVALLFAVLSVRPIPFCVLDEVDAALDEANVGRFCSALRELAQQTQFIVITHNRNTMEIADSLYGVSMPADSISQVVSLRLTGEATGEDLAYVR